MTETSRSSTLTLGREYDVRERVAISQAENDFGQVQQSLSTPRAVNEVVSYDSDSVDLEGGRDRDSQEMFDLWEYLTSSNNANSAAGIKHKHVGVTWEDLEVSGIGGEENKVCHSMRYPPSFCLTVCDYQIYVSTYAGEGFYAFLHSFF